MSRLTSLVRERALSIAVVLTTVVIIVFAVLQYRWSDEVSEATAVRLADTLQMSMVNWQIDLRRNLSEITTTMHGVPEHSALDELREYELRFDEWLSLARYKDLVSAVYLLQAAQEDSAGGLSDETTTWRLGREGGGFTPASWPAVVSPRDLAVTRATSAEPAGTEETGWAAWRFQADPPVLVHVLPARVEGLRRWVAVELDPAVLRDRIFPDLAHRYFQGTGGLDYEVAVAFGPPPRTVVYTSDLGFGSDHVIDADGTMNVFGRSRGNSTTLPVTVFHETSRRESASAAGVSWPPLLGDAGAGDDWELIVRHRRGGPLGTFVADAHRRDLVISFVALLLLVVSIAMLVMTSHRAQRLASLQMDFVTTVSHELRTPLAVISSAADNIAQGIVEERGQLKRYGSVIGHQVRQLSGLVEQILLFASQSNGSQQFTLEPLEVADVIEATLASTEGLIQAGQFTVECVVDPNLPPAQGDRVAVSQCLQNLMTNALKYGRDQRWMGIRAGLVEHGDTREIQIAVSDRGIGIAPGEIPKIFEPFYRSPSAAAAQIRGTGLGLSLARRMAEAMHGRITVASEPGRGSTFTLHLPPADVRTTVHVAGSSRTANTHA